MRKSRVKIRKSEKKGWDVSFLVLTCVLTILGIVAVADASAPQAAAFFLDSFYFVKQQLIWGGVGFVALAIASVVNYQFWKKIATFAFILNLVLLLVVLIPGIGNKLLGARRWISAGPLSFQPSELVKFTLALYIAKLADSNKKIVAYIVPLVLVAGLIMLQPDLGTTIIVLMTGLTQMFVAEVSILPFMAVAGFGGVIGFILIITSGYRKQRLLTFLKITSDPLSSSYHIRQVLIALGSGGIFGVGLGQGRQKYLFLPEAATDSVFATLAEEVGFIGCLVVLFLLGFFIYKAFLIALRAPDRFSSVLASGIVAWIGGQIFLNIASMVALVPLTGVPLPFFSYGGSSLTMILLGVGILLNISKYEQR